MQRFVFLQCYLPFFYFNKLTVINLFFSLKKDQNKEEMAACLTKEILRKSFKIFILFVIFVLRFSVLLINFILPSFSGLLNTDKCDLAYSSKSHKFMSRVTRLIYSRPDDEEAPLLLHNKAVKWHKANASPSHWPCRK